MARATKAYSAGSVKYDITCASLPFDSVLLVVVTFDASEDVAFLSFSSLSRNLNPFRRSLFRSAFILPLLRNDSIECVRNYDTEEKNGVLHAQLHAVIDDVVAFVILFSPVIFGNLRSDLI